MRERELLQRIVDAKDGAGDTGLLDELFAAIEAARAEVARPVPSVEEAANGLFDAMASYRYASAGLCAREAGKKLGEAVEEYASALAADAFAARDEYKAMCLRAADEIRKLQAAVERHRAALAELLEALDEALDNGAFHQDSPHLPRLALATKALGELVLDDAQKESGT